MRTKFRHPNKPLALFFVWQTYKICEVSWSKACLSHHVSNSHITAKDFETFLDGREATIDLCREYLELNNMRKPEKDDLFADECGTLDIDEDTCISILKDKGYKIQKPVITYEEI